MVSFQDFFHCSLNRRRSEGSRFPTNGLVLDVTGRQILFSLLCVLSLSLRPATGGEGEGR